MASFREIQDFIALAYNDKHISNEEFVLLYDEFQPANLDLPYSSYGEFDLDSMEEDECRAEFRVRKRDLEVLAEALQIPPVFKCNQRSKVDGMEGMCMMLKRYAYPCRYSDMIQRFGKPVPVLSMATNAVTNFVFTNHSHLITEWNHNLIDHQALLQYSQAIRRKGAPLNNCFGFIDGTVRPISKPGRHQRLVYNGHKRVHALKFQSVALPNGLIGNLYGPVGMYAYVLSMFLFQSNFSVFNLFFSLASFLTGIWSLKFYFYSVKSRNFLTHRIFFNLLLKKTFFDFCF